MSPLNDVVARSVLRISALGFLAFGLWALVAPRTMLGLVGLEITSPAAGAEARAYYGGLEIGFAWFVWRSALTRHAAPAALAACSIYAGCVFGRVAGLLIEHSFDAFVVASGLGEMAGAVATGWAHRRLVNSGH